MDCKNHNNKIRCKLLNIHTGETGWIEGGSVWWWCEGNGSCDCNRYIEGEKIDYESSDNIDHCVASDYIVIDVDISNIAVGHWEYMFNYEMDEKEVKRKFLQEANSDYAYVLLKHGIGRKCF